MQALQSLTRHQLVMSNSFVDHQSHHQHQHHHHRDTVSEPGDSPTLLHRTPPPFSSSASPNFPSYRRRSSAYHQHPHNAPHGGGAGTFLRRSQSLQEGLNNQSYSTAPRSRFDMCRGEARRLTSWSEYTVRRTLVRYRTRKSAVARRMHSLRRLSGQRRVPAEVIKDALDHQYEVCRSEEAGTGERLVAVFFCWFFGWIMDLYYNLTEQGTERSFVKWVLATLLVTSGALLVIGLTCFALHQLNIVILLLLNAGTLYITFLWGLLVCILATLAIVNFD